MNHLLYNNKTIYSHFYSYINNLAYFYQEIAHISPYIMSLTFIFLSHHIISGMIQVKHKYFGPRVIGGG